MKVSILKKCCQHNKRQRNVQTRYKIPIYHIRKLKFKSNKQQPAIYYRPTNIPFIIFYRGKLNNRNFKNRKSFFRHVKKQILRLLLFINSVNKQTTDQIFSWKTHDNNNNNNNDTNNSNMRRSRFFFYVTTIKNNINNINN